jgi:hypothetical protein
MPALPAKLLLPRLYTQAEPIGIPMERDCPFCPTVSVGVLSGVSSGRMLLGKGAIMCSQISQGQAGGDKMLEIEALSRETVYNVMKELLYSFNYMWLQFEEWIKRRYPEDSENEDLRKIHEDFGSYQAKRLSKALNTSGGGIDALIELAKHSHWAVFENIELEKLTEKSFRMRTIECSSQRAAKRWGLEYYDCTLSSSLCRNGFFKETNQKVKIQRVFTPPETRPEGTPENVSCEWLISVEA